MSAARIALVVLLAAAAFGGAFAVAKSGSGDDGGVMPEAESIRAPNGSPEVPGFTPPAVVPALKAPPAPPPSSGGSSGGTAPAPTAPAPAPAPPSGGGGGVILEG